MNKMAKGALATGVGVALLLGGGGTLAVWNDTAAANAGKIVAGDLKLQTKPGVWTNAKGSIVDLDPTNNVADYVIVPGDVLTYKQSLDVTLVGDLMQANLTLNTAEVLSNFAPGDVTVAGPVLKNATGDVLPNTILTPKTNGAITASATFAFDNKSGNLSSAKAAVDLKSATYKLNQMPVSATK